MGSLLHKKRVLVTGAGGTPSTNFVRSLRDAPEPFYLIGTDSDKYAVHRSETDEKHLVPEATDPAYIDILKQIIEETKAEFIHAQPDAEVYAISKNRKALPVLTYLPQHRTVEICQNKMESYKCWAKAGLKVPKTILIQNELQLRKAFEEFKGKKTWLREISGAFGKGSIPATNFELAKSWMDFRRGWGRFTIAECLEPQSTTWLSIWKNGELIVAQGRKRLYWEFANRSPSGVTGITGTGVTISDPLLDKIAQEAIFAIDKEPHGIFGVDLTYDKEGMPNPTEINIGRFFTTHYFFTKAGLNMPYIYVKLAYDEAVPKIKRKINPLPPGLFWIRGMDFLPVMVSQKEIERYKKELTIRKCAKKR